MSKENIFFSQKKDINKDYFRGEVVMLEVLNKNNSIEYEMYHVLFKKGALTTLHYHETEQILIGTKGKGILCFFESNFIENISATEKTIVLDEGDVASIPPFIWHFHGSLKDDFAHVAFRNRYRIDSNGNKQQANNLWEKDFLNRLTHLNTNEINRLSLQIDQKVKEIVRNELERITN